ncbi:hypothetical protein [Jiangella anatolica]|uniref:Uncharacterized protein n=1 Tax=Jiangella anatolica TaxID=2670374 RepID=A0A2W2C8U2_9ACTN|nr:hypothetical protein [Jiangella anatolica]PZF84569.1 hypothetical protein C1I92_07940 [Jiangella anatolica]
MEAAALFMAPFALSVLAALVVRRWWALVVPAVAVPLYYAGLRYGWWGDGVGDGAWLLLAAFLTAVAVAGCAVVIGVFRLLARRP